MSLIEIVDRDASFAWVKVRTEEVRALSDLTSLPPRSADTGSLVILGTTGAGRPPHLSRAGDYAFVEASLEGDVGEWAVCHNYQGAWSLLVQGLWDFHSDIIYAGRRLLSEKELAALELDRS